MSSNTRVKNMFATNYGCIGDLEVDTDRQVVCVNGKNGVGKTTVMGIFFDSLTDKTCLGTKVDDIRPHDKNGNPKNYDPIVRGLTLEVTDDDGTVNTYKIRKERRAKFHRDGSFDKNDNVAFIDDFEYKPKQLAEAIASIIGDMAMTYGIAPRAFIELNKQSTPLARAALEKISGYDVSKFIADHPEYADVAKLMKGHTGEEVKKKLKKAASDVSKSIDLKNAELNYEKRTYQTPAINIEEQKQMIEQFSADIATCDEEMAKIENASRAFDDIAKKIISLRYEQQLIAKKAIDAAGANKRNAERAVNDIKWKIRKCEDDIENYHNLIEAETARMARLAVARNEDADAWRAEKARTFNPSEAVCSYCGQALPEDKVEALMKRFEAAKNKRIDEIVESGKKKQTEIKRCEAKIENFKHHSEELNVEIENLKKDLETAVLTAEEQVDDVDISKIPEYIEITNQIASLEEKTSDSNSISTEKKALWERKNNLASRKAEAIMLVERAMSAISSHETRLKALEEELRNLGQQFANIQRERDIIDDFSKAANNDMESYINKYFTHFQFKMLDETADGTLFETCRMMVNGTDYFSGLNHGDQMLVEIDLVKGIQDMLGVKLPIFVDDGESLDKDRIPDVGRQLFVLRRTDDPELVIC